MSPKAPNFLVDKGFCLHVFMIPQAREPVLTDLMGKDILYNNMNFPDRAAARAVCLVSRAARGDYGGCDSTRAARLGSHAACGGYCSARSMRAQREVQLALRNNYYISAAPRKYLFIRLPHWGLISFFRRRRGQ